MCTTLALQAWNAPSLGPRALSPTHTQFLRMTFFTPRNEKSGRAWNHGVTSKVERRYRELDCARVGGKQTVANAFVQSPVTRRCTAMYILLARRKAIPSPTVTCTVEYIYDLCMHTYIVRGASTLSVYAYTTYDTGQYHHATTQQQLNH